MIHLLPGRYRRVRDFRQDATAFRRRYADELVKVGEEWDDEDGLEWVFEVPVEDARL